MAKPFEKYRCGVTLRMLFLGIFIGGIPMAGLGAWHTWQYPQIESKDDSDEDTIMGQACIGFCVGAVLGGLAGLIGSAVLGIREDLSDSQSGPRPRISN
jgi:hypothetical protein